ncbi:MAG: DNA-binding protein [Chryseobacterium sp.]|uniref:helix-turn-helix domain-containing protein n=1 Tax=Chryseobacterium sp. TaxID=1871047 RepID=UPI000DB1C2FC|nr:helix-turn-helix domain-containing protein [Chryseobacterium sp.]MPS65968.1 DNA-binding protein [Chryseobacterium sp.]PZU05358.1 MAG: DNA-binding protein [Chryseobacterium sp.]
MEFFKEFFKTIEDLIDDKLNQFECKLAEMYKPEGKELMTRDETAEYFGVSLGTLNNWSKNGILVPINFGGRVYYTRNEIQAKLRLAS